MAQTSLATNSMMQRVLVVEDDDDVRSGVCAMLETEGRSIIACRDRESAELILEHEELDAVIVDVRLADSFNFDGLNVVDAAAKVAARPIIIAITGDASPKLRAEASRRGASALLEKPMCGMEVEALIGAPESDAPLQCCEVPTIAEVLRSGNLRTVFLPVFMDGGTRTYGYEALTRLDGGTPFDNPEILFAYAGKKDQLVELELRCMENAFRESASLPEDSALFINLHPAVLARAAGFAAAVRERAARWSVRLDRIVLEITEQARLENIAAWIADIEALRNEGVRIAFDDFGVAYSHLLQIEMMRPSFIKLSMWCGDELETDPTKQKIVRNTLALAQEFNSRVIVEGMETSDAVDTATKLGVRLLQGFHFGRPAPAENFR